MAIDQLEDMVDEQIHKDRLDALMKMIHALEPLERASKIEMLKCVRQFYSLPIVD